MQLIWAMALNEDLPFMSTADGAGALAIHGIMVGNQLPALKLGLRIFRSVPESLLLVHSPPVFTEENSFHIMCVNRHEKVRTLREMPATASASGVCLLTGRTALGALPTGRPCVRCRC